MNIDNLQARGVEQWRGFSKFALRAIGLAIFAFTTAACGGDDGKKGNNIFDSINNAVSTSQAGATVESAATAFRDQLNAIDATSQAGMQATAEYGAEQFHIQLTAQAAQKTPRP